MRTQHKRAIAPCTYIAKDDEAETVVSDAVATLNTVKGKVGCSIEDGGSGFMLEKSLLVSSSSIDLMDEDDALSISKFSSNRDASKPRSSSQMGPRALANW